MAALDCSWLVIRKLNQRTKRWGDDEVLRHKEGMKVYNSGTLVWFIITKLFPAWQYICQSPHHHHKVETSTDNDPFKVNSSDHQHSNHYHRYIAKHVTTGVSPAYWIFVICICVYWESVCTPRHPLRLHLRADSYSFWFSIDNLILQLCLENIQCHFSWISVITKQVWCICLNDWFKCMNMNI